VTTSAWSRTRRVARVLLPAMALGLLGVFLLLYFERGFVPGDSFTYLAAGERLNAGHPLYALSPGDRPVDLHPPYWTAPFLSPPFIAVLWRPLAALPSELGVYVWWAGAITCLAVVLGALMGRRRLLTSVAILALVVPLTYEIGVGNVNAYLLAGAVAVWLLARDGRALAAGPLAAVMTAVKLTPFPLAAWVIGTDGRRGLAGVLAGLAVCGLISLVGAGLAAHVEFVSVARATGTTGLTQFSLGGIARAAGLPDPIPTLVPTAFLLGAALVAALLPRRGHPAAGYVAAILGWTFGTAVLNVNTLVLLVALLAPIAWPWRTAGPDAVLQPA
jgi:hypothetical protein